MITIHLLHILNQYILTIPVLRFNGDDLDFVNNKEDLQFILDKVDSTIRKGVSFT